MMKRGLIAGAVLLLIASAAASKPEAPPEKGLFATLKARDSVFLKDGGSSYVISTVDEPMPMTHEVVEIGRDYVVLKDLAGVVEVRIPVFSVKAVIHRKTKPK